MSVKLKNLKITPILFALFVSLFFSGCGYRLLDSGSQQDVTPVVIAIKPVINQTSDPKLDWRVTDCIIKELTSWPGIKIRPYDEAEYCISGNILSYRSQIPYTYDSRQNPLEYKISLLMSFSMSRIEDTDYSKGKEGQQTISHPASAQTIPNLQEDEIYRINPSDLGQSKIAEWQAVERAVKRMIKRAMDQFIGLTGRN
ncbi:hypothetical protein JXL19_05930 [bacterium]|nr:hypothetical protein [bacterium]